MNIIQYNTIIIVNIVTNNGNINNSINTCPNQENKNHFLQ